MVNHTLLAIDPGRGAKPSIGYSIWWWRVNPSSGQGTTPEEVERGETNFEQLCIDLAAEAGQLKFRTEYLTEVVIEDFVNDPGVNRGGQRNGTSEVIGAVEYACFRGSTMFTRQRSSILTTAKLHTGYVQKLKHLPHKDAAYLHGAEYLIGKGLLQVAPLD